MDKRVLSNQRVTVWIGPDTGIADYAAPTLAEIQAMTNVSGAINWNSFAFNVQASTNENDRTLVDAAGAQSRSFTQFGGNIEFVWPKPDDTSSIFRQAYNIVKEPHTSLAVVVRVLTLNSAGVAIGDVVNAYRTITDANAPVRGAASIGYTINFLPNNDVGINAIVPSAVPTAVAVTPAGPLTVAVGAVSFLRAAYESVNVTVGAEWVSSDETVAVVTPHGAVIGVSAGTATITSTYPGSAAGTPITVTVSAS